MQSGQHGAGGARPGAGRADGVTWGFLSFISFLGGGFLSDTYPEHVF
jgi:hypothetical protein